MGRQRLYGLNLLSVGHLIALILLTRDGSVSVSEETPTCYKGTSMIESIIQFGDSLSDTGNYGVENPESPFCMVPPYGESTFGRPTGRCSNGLLIVDFLASSFALPLLNPYLNRSLDFNHGVNFAVVGATALNATTLAAMNITSPFTNSSLSVQLGWFKNHLNFHFRTKQQRRDKLERSLILLGEIGGNDFNYALLRGNITPQDIAKLNSEVIGVIKNAVKEVIKEGATKVFIPGNLPGGCLPIYLSMVPPNDDPNMYDDLHCLKGLNSLSQLYNLQLQQAIKDLQQQYPTASIIYGDYYSAFTSLLLNASSLGFEKDKVFMVCCGKGDNPYNFGGITQFCGLPGVESCRQPTKRIHWDGIHLTQQAYQYMALYLLPSILDGITPSS